MIIIGLVLFLAAAIFGVDVADKNRFRTRDIQAFGDSLGVSGAAHLYVIGAITGAALVLGLALVLAGLGRKGSKARSRRRERKDLAHQDTEVERLRRQNEEMRLELDGRRAGSTVDAPVAER
jgi:hypothetical protein